MPARSESPSKALEDALAACLDALQSRGPAALDQACAEHPEHADDLRRRVALLQRSGLLDAEPEGIRDFPERLGGFHLLRPLGSGGMGVVYVAEEEALGRRVALKLIRPEQLFFAGARERFRREVQTVAGLQHPGIVPVYSVGDESGLPYFAMELVHGASLSDVLGHLAERDPAKLDGADLASALERAAPLEGRVDRLAQVFRGSWVEVCLRIVHAAAEAVQYAHSRGVLHRDIKPSNLMLTPDGRVQLVDFGVSSSQHDGRITSTGARVGSLLYMSPERLRGESADERADVYALGVTLYELLALEAPFRDESSALVQASILDGRVPALRERNPRVTRDAETVCLKALERDASRRYPNVTELAIDLARVLAFEPILARRASRLLRLRRWSQRHPAAALGAVLGSLIVFGMPTALLVQQRRSNRSLARSNAELAAALEREAAERDRAEGNVRRALDSVNTMLTSVARDLHEIPHMDATRKHLLDEAVRLTEELEQQGPLDRRGRAQLAEMYLTRGRVQGVLGERAVRLDDMRTALDHFDAMATEAELSPASRYAYGETLLSLGRELMVLERYDEALLALQHAVQLFAEGVDGTQQGQQSRAGLLTALRETTLAQSVLGNRAAALERMTHVVRQAEAAIPAGGASLGERVLLAELNYGLCRLLYLGSRRADALRHATRAAELLNEALQQEPEHLGAREVLSELCDEHGNLLLDAGRYAAGEAVFRQGYELALALIDDFPTIIAYHERAARQARGLASARTLQGAWEEADAMFAEAYERATKLTEGFPDAPAAHSLLGDVLMHWSTSMDQRGELEQALELVRRSQESHLRSVEGSAYAKNLRLSSRWGQAKIIEGKLLAAQGDATAAAECVEAGLEHDGGDPFAHREAAKVFADCAASTEFDDRGPYLERAFTALERAVELGLAQPLRHLEGTRFDPLRADARFAELVARLQGDRP